MLTIDRLGGNFSLSIPRESNLLMEIIDEGLLNVFNSPSSGSPKLRDLASLEILLEAFGEGWEIVDI